MIKFARISKNGFLGRFGTVRPKFWALKFFSGLFVKPAVKHNGNELEYAKSAKSNVVNLRKLRKIQFLGQFGPIWSILGPNFFSSKIQKRHFSRLTSG